jgi:hypothetical protein
MLPALNHGERVVFLSGMRAHVPLFVFDGGLAIARAHLREADYHKLMAAFCSMVRAVGFNADHFAARAASRN